MTIDRITTALETENDYSEIRNVTIDQREGFDGLVLSYEDNAGWHHHCYEGAVTPEEIAEALEIA